MARVNPRMLIDGAGDYTDGSGTVTAPKTPTQILQELQDSVTAGKEFVQSKNVEIATVALEQAINTGNTTAAAAAAGKLADAQGLKGAEKTILITQARQNAQTTVESNRELSKPTDDPGPGNIWSYSVSEGRWKKVFTGVGLNDWYTDSNGMVFYKGKPFTGTKDGVQYIDGKGPGYKELSGGNPPIKPGTDPTTLALITSLQNQIAALSAGNQQAAIDKAAAEEAAKKEKAENAIAVLTDRFTRYGLASLVPKIKELAISGASEATITLQLQESDEYKQRFRANEDRIKKGLTVLQPGDYLALEDDYRQILRAYGLRQFDNDDYVTQFISNDISTTELSNRVVTAVQRVQNADPAILTTLRSFYGISDNDLVAYVLDPNQQFQKIERQVAAAEIGAAASLQGLSAGVAVSEQLAAQGVTKAQAQKGYATIADILPTAEKLSDIYKGTEDEYRQAEAEQEVFNTLASAQRKRQKLTQREIASFSGTSGLNKASLSKQLGGNI